jgi:hypothetical protein
MSDSANGGARLIAQNKSYGPNADRWAGPAPTLNENSDIENIGWAMLPGWEFVNSQRI